MWEQIRSNRLKSVFLVVAMAAVLVLIGFFMGAFIGNEWVGLIFALIIWGVMSLVAYFQGDNIFLSISKARKIERDDNPRLYNIVEEMKIASGLPHMPDIYIIDDPAMNAFATGRNPEKAAVVVTSGLLQKLNRDELQGVIGHEVSHINNRDVLLMTMCGVMLGTIVMISWYLTRVMFWGGVSGRRSSGGGGQAQIILLVVGLVLMIIAPILAQLIYFAISRKREYLADASSAQYTRYPEGLASALGKIGGSTVQLQSANQALAPMYISNPFRKKGHAASDLSSTHPPISERIRILRSMGGASFADYNNAFVSIHQGRGDVIPASALAGAGSVGLRAASSENTVGDPGRLERTREVSDLMWRKSNYKTINCSCGTKLRVPPNVKSFTITCPHCGATHTV